MDNMTELEFLEWAEARHGPLQKTIRGGFSMGKVDSIQSELTAILNKYKSVLNIKTPVPRMRVWATEDKLNFIFLDRITGRRILLANWLSGKDSYYEH